MDAWAGAWMHKLGKGLQGQRDWGRLVAGPGCRQRTLKVVLKVTARRQEW